MTFLTGVQKAPDQEYDVFNSSIDLTKWIVGADIPHGTITEDETSIGTLCTQNTTQDGTFTISFSTIEQAKNGVIVTGTISFNESNGSNVVYSQIYFGSVLVYNSYTGDSHSNSFTMVCVKNKDGTWDITFWYPGGGASTNIQVASRATIHLTNQVVATPYVLGKGGTYRYLANNRYEWANVRFDSVRFW